MYTLGFRRVNSTAKYCPVSTSTPMYGGPLGAETSSEKEKGIRVNAVELRYLFASSLQSKVEIVLNSEYANQQYVHSGLL